MTYSANIIPVMTSATAPNGVASASSVLGAGYPAWLAFDHVNSGNGWIAAAGTTGYPQYQFPAAHIVTQYAVTSRSEASPYVRAPKTWTFKGSNDGSTWVTLDTRTNITDWATSPNVRKVFNLTNTTAYLYYRLDITASNDASYVGIGELEMMETAPPSPLAFLWTNSYLPAIAGDLTAIKASHVDIVFSYVMSVAVSDADMQAYLDALDAAGLQAMITVRELGKNVVMGRGDKVLSGGELAALDAFVDKWKTHPAVWGWYADDEGTAAQYPISTRQQVYDTIKAAHPAGQVLEVNFGLVTGAYSPDVHDVFALDSYPFYYDFHTGGCISPSTGLVTELWMATDALDGFKAHLDGVKASLIAAGETNYLVLMQAFGQGPDGAAYVAAMPPASGLWRMWGKVREAGFDGYGAGWFLWKSELNTMPGEHLLGVGDAPYAAQRAELAAIAAMPATYDSETFGTFEISPPVPFADTTPRAPVYSVMVGGEDVTELVDLDTLHRSLSERGEASATIDVPVADANEIPCNFFARDATVAIDIDGGREWLGHVVAVHKPQPQDLSYTLDCAGGWDTLHHCAPWCKAFVETRYDAVTEYPPNLYAPVSGGAFKVMTTLDVNTDGQVQFTLPKGSKVKLNQARFAYLWPLSGMDPGLVIERVAGTLVCGGSGTLALSIEVAEAGPFGVVETAVVASALSDAAYSTTFDVTDFAPLTAPTHLRFWAAATADVTETSGEEFVQSFDLRIYFNRTTAPRVDEIVAAIDAEVRPGAPAASTEAIGSPLTAFMCDPFMTPAEGIAVALTKAAVPPLCGIIQNRLIIKNRSTAPSDGSRLWTVSEQLTPGLEWGVEVDEEQSVDYVGVAYNVILSESAVPDGTPQIAYYPSAPPNAAARIALTDGGDLTAAEAWFYAQQGYHYLHKLVSGPVTIPYVVQDANGNERPVDVIRAWDWVQNVGSLDAELAGPFLVSEVEHQGHIATLTIGAAEAYAYNGPDRMPTKGRYVGAHRVRTRTKKRVSFAEYWKWKHRKDKHKPKMPRRHAKYGTIRGYKWTDVEGRYT